MKNVLALIALSFLTPGLAQAEDGPAHGSVIYRGRCLVYAAGSDYRNGPTLSKEVALSHMATVDIGSHGGISYEVTAVDLTDPADLRPRRELMLAARDEKSHAVLGSANAVYSQEIPEQVFSQTPLVGQFYCASH